ncbi:MAG TPA: ABC transporter permease, partial [Acidimicrobiales bacterium]|nr:ABC transporter permease [Acidimicrobiales bacterium]
MLRITLAAAWSRKRRLVGTALAIVLGVAFLAATIVVGDSARAGFAVAFDEANAGIDAVVQSERELTAAEDGGRIPIDASLLDAIAAHDDVAAVAPIVEGMAQLLDREGSTIGGNGPPTVAASWIDDPSLTGWDLRDGRSPGAPGEVVVDAASAADAGVSVGDTLTVLVPRPIEVTVVGIAGFGDDDSIGGTTFVGFTLVEAQALLLGGEDRVTGVAVAAVDDVSEEALVASLRPVLPAGVEAITGTELTERM